MNKKLIILLLTITLVYTQYSELQPTVFNGLYKRSVCQSGCCCQDLTQIQYQQTYDYEGQSIPGFSFTNIFLGKNSCNITSPQLNNFTYVGTMSDFWTDLQNYGEIQNLENEFKNLFTYKVNGTNVEIINNGAPLCNSLLLNVTNLFASNSYQS